MTSIWLADPISSFLTKFHFMHFWWLKIHGGILIITLKYVRKPFSVKFISKRSWWAKKRRWEVLVTSTQHHRVDASDCQLGRHRHQCWTKGHFFGDGRKYWLRCFFFLQLLQLQIYLFLLNLYRYPLCQFVNWITVTFGTRRKKEKDMFGLCRLH